MADRSCRLARELQLHDVSMVGSHELRLNEFDRLLEMHRFPAEVNFALSHGPDHACLLPTTALYASAYRRSGGFSTAYRMAADTQYIWRSSFSLKIRNVDAFLYLRNKGPGSLTTHRGTGMNAPTRLRLRQCWRNAFVDVSSGAIEMEASALAPVRPESRGEFFRL
jgi:hypothetical protein